MGNFDMKEENIRSDWNHALESVEGGCNLSYAIGWGFTQQDLIVLCALHRAGKHQQKIVDLLEDCNFHRECGLLYEHKHDECMEVIMKDRD